MTPATQTRDNTRRSIQKWTLLVGLILLGLAVADGIRVPQQFFRFYLLAFTFWIGLPLGCSAFLMVHYLTGGSWGIPLKRPLETAVGVLPLFALLLIPLLFGLHRLFPWAQQTTVQDPAASQNA